MVLYYIVYGVLYTISLLPLRVLYLLSDFAFFILFRIMKYRQDVVLNNLAIAFPEKSLQERQKIAKEFYLNFTDTFIESIKMISISRKEVEKRSHCEFGYINELIAKGRNIHIMAGHQFNWEFANLVYAMYVKIPFVGIYAPVNNKIIDKIFFKVRSRYGTIMISTRDFRNKMHNVFTNQYILALAADQNPSNPANAFWLKFFSQPAPFVTGPGKGAVKNNTAVVFVGFEKVKRGYYKFRIVPITENGTDHTAEQLTLMYKKVLEDTIRKNPSNYLWSHRRWRHEWKEGYPAIIQ
ncbi:lysophospholipid acyltransferase family protein [Terrimonas pollutisoli]|uniref:lysophospholipid acyltransferase family protein n=1 Tax=Terrimonas pollutisoli TaxID=3034147 RepID=UPI0023EDDB7E|nr:lysophospholipid acyltransferase family protein [Terrimonas sp. H1YJ31]